MIVVITAIAVLVLEFVGKKVIRPFIVYLYEKIQEKNESKKELEKRVQYIEDKLGIDSDEYKWKSLSPYAEDEDERSKILNELQKTKK